MRAELPWNVAGIPPEAREAARAAARREGLSVGEWLTRRILRSFSDLGDDPQPLPYDRAQDRSLDSWGLPQSTAARRDTEEMLARVSRSESESSDAWRKIEDQLRGVARRLDSSERSQSENNRVLSRTASEINVAAREQAQALDQMSQTIVSLSERMERVEREKAQDSTKDAVKALHQGLARVADQIGHTATQSAHQVSQLTQNLEQLAARLNQTRNEAEDGDKTLDQRIGAAEKSAQFTTNALDHALEKIEAQAAQRATDQVEAQRRAGGLEESILRLEDSVARLERAGADHTLERRLESVESGLSSLAQRFDGYNPLAPVEDAMHVLTRRLDSLEKKHGDLVDEMRANIAAPAPKTDFAANFAKIDPAANAFAPAPKAAPQPPPAMPAFEAPPFAEVPAFVDAAHAQNDAPFLPPYGAEAFAPDAFAAPDADAPTDPFAPLGAMVDPFPAEGQTENFLAAARRSAREAAEKSDVEKAGLFAGLRRRIAKPEAEPQAATEEKSRLMLPLLVAAVVVVAVAAGIVASQRLHRAPVTITPTGVSKPLSNPAPFTVTPPAALPAPQLGAPPAGSPAPHLDLPNNVRGAPVRPVPSAPAGKTAAPPPAAAPVANGPQPVSTDRVLQLANNGNATAETILGLRALDGTDGTAANAGDAFKWLTKAANQGQAVAQYRLGTMYERGQGVPANAGTAAHWYELASNQGNRKAMHNLAVAFAQGTNGKKNMAEAARWFSRAASLGLSDSQFNLAVLYERGDGVPQSLLDAYKWYAIATAQGDTESKQRLEVLQTQLSDADRAAAQKSAASFKPAPLNRAANVPPEPADLSNG